MAFRMNSGIFKIIGLVLLLGVSALLIPFGLVMVEPNEVRLKSISSPEKLIHRP